MGIGRSQDAIDVKFSQLGVAGRGNRPRGAVARCGRESQWSWFLGLGGSATRVGGTGEAPKSATQRRQIDLDATPCGRGKQEDEKERRDETRRRGRYEGG
jgi:hypothetical protein